MREARAAGPATRGLITGATRPPRRLVGSEDLFYLKCSLLNRWKISFFLFIIFAVYHYLFNIYDSFKTLL